MYNIARISITGLFFCIIVSCLSDPAQQPASLYKGSFQLTAPYTEIKSQIDGGGIFLVGLTPGQSFEGSVEFTVKADSCLHAEPDRTILNTENPVAEITIAPDKTTKCRQYKIEVNTNGSTASTPLILTVDVVNWPAGISGDARNKLEELLNWLKTNHPEITIDSDQEWQSCLTYPQILVVEHWTFLSTEYEIRLCYHVMIPPHDWSFYRIRPRGEIKPILAVKRDSSDQPFHEIPVSEYPLMFGY